MSCKYGYNVKCGLNCGCNVMICVVTVAVIVHAVCLVATVRAVCVVVTVRSVCVDDTVSVVCVIAAGSVETGACCRQNGKGVQQGTELQRDAAPSHQHRQDR